MLRMEKVGEARMFEENVPCGCRVVVSCRRAEAIMDYLVRPLQAQRYPALQIASRDAEVRSTDTSGLERELSSIMGRTI